MSQLKLGFFDSFAKETYHRDTAAKYVLPLLVSFYLSFLVVGPWEDKEAWKMALKLFM